MNSITSTRTVIPQIFQRSSQNYSPRIAQKARFPPPTIRRLSHPAYPVKAPSQGIPISNNWQWQQRHLATASGVTGRSDKPPVSPHVTFYTMFGRPIAKIFLIAMGTYQALYWCWLKLEAVEGQKGKQDEIDRLEEEVRTKIMVT